MGAGIVNAVKTGCGIEGPLNRFMRPLMIGESREPPVNILLTIFPTVDKMFAPPPLLPTVLFTSACVFRLILSTFSRCTGSRADSCLLASVTAVPVSFKVVSSTCATVGEAALSGELDRAGKLVQASTSGAVISLARDCLTSRSGNAAASVFRVLLLAILNLRSQFSFQNAEAVD